MKKKSVEVVPEEPEPKKRKGKEKKDKKKKKAKSPGVVEESPTSDGKKK